MCGTEAMRHVKPQLRPTVSVVMVDFSCSSEPKVLFSYKSQIDEPEDTDVHLPPTTVVGRKVLGRGPYSNTQIDGSAAYLDDVVSGPFGVGSINNADSDHWRPINV